MPANESAPTYRAFPYRVDSTAQAEQRKEAARKLWRDQLAQIRLTLRKH